MCILIHQVINPQGYNFEILFFNIIEAFYMNFPSPSLLAVGKQLQKSFFYILLFFNALQCKKNKTIKLPSILNKSDLGIPVIRSTHNPLVIKSNTANKLLVPFQNPQTCSTLNIPQPGERD